MPEWHHQKINRPTPAKSPPCPVHEDGGSGHVLNPDDSLSPHGGITEPSAWEGKGREGEMEGEGNGVSATDVADAPKSLALLENDREDVARICEHLASRIEANGAKRPTVTSKWRDAARLMLDRDQLTETEVMGAIDWCQADEFWRANILSLPKLREKYDQLRLQAQRRQGGGSRQQETDDLFERAAQRMGVIQ
jgi:hypothetical protein